MSLRDTLKLYKYAICCQTLNLFTYFSISIDECLVYSLLTINIILKQNRTNLTRKSFFTLDFFVLLTCALNFWSTFSYFLAQHMSLFQNQPYEEAYFLLVESGIQIPSCSLLLGYIALKAK